MTTLIGTITDSQGVGLTGTLIITLQDPQQLADLLLSTAPASFNIVDGVVNVTVMPAYNVNIKFVVGDVTYLNFNTDIPTSLVVNISDLLPAVPRETLELNLLRVAAILTQVPEYLAAIKTQFNWRGAWNPLLTYTKSDFVDYVGSSYIYVSPVNGNETPGTGAKWQLNASIGATGSGITGSATAYGPSWSGVMAAPAKTVMYDTLETLFAKKADYSNLALKNDTVLTGNPTAPTPDTSDNSNRITTTGHLWTALSNILNPADTTTPFAPNTALNDSSNRIANTKAVMDAIANLGIVKGTSSFRLGPIIVCYGTLTTTSISWTAGAEQTFVVTLPDSISLMSTQFISAQWISSSGSTGTVNTRCSPQTSSTINVSVRTALSATAVISIYWLAIGSS